MKKKLVFMLINMNVGGTEKALLNMLSKVPKEKYEITILMLEEYGGFLNYIPSDVHIEYFRGYAKIKSILNQQPYKLFLNFLKAGKLIKAFNIMSLHLFSKIMGERSIVFKYVLKDFKNIENEYDVAVAYAGPMDFISYFVINKIKARRKIQWIHFDVTQIGFNHKFAAKIYRNFDKVFIVSEEGKNKLVKVLPALQKKIEVFGNYLSPENVREMADNGEGFVDKFVGVRILTVGRLSKEKGQDLAISVLAKLKQIGYNVRWYCIGEGNERKDYERQIREYGLEKDFVLLGAISNPYPFMKQCDLYVQTSRHEGYCITLAEARCLQKPIITTNFTGAREQIIHEKTGLIIGCNELEIYSAIKKVLSNAKILEKFSDNLAKEFDENTQGESKQFQNSF
jgi:glycosyltransferase involved in cell wall biosynthesis